MVSPSDLILCSPSLIFRLATSYLDILKISFFSSSIFLILLFFEDNWFESFLVMSISLVFESFFTFKCFHKKLCKNEPKTNVIKQSFFDLFLFLKTYWATQWAAVKICLSSIRDPPQNWRPLFIRAAIQGHSLSSASFPFTILETDIIIPVYNSRNRYYYSCSQF